MGEKVNGTKSFRKNVDNYKEDSYLEHGEQCLHDVVRDEGRVFWFHLFEDTLEGCTEQGLQVVVLHTLRLRGDARLHLKDLKNNVCHNFSCCKNLKIIFSLILAEASPR